MLPGRARASQRLSPLDERMDASGTGNLIRDNRDRKSPVQGFIPPDFAWISCQRELPACSALLMPAQYHGASTGTIVEI